MKEKETGENTTAAGDSKATGTPKVPDEVKGSTEIIRQLLDILQKDNSDEMMAIKRRIYERIAEESEVKPTRIPRPLNITEVGGYYNLLEKLGDEKMQRRLIASALGLPMD